MWGSEPTCTAIEMAHENKVNNINYIAAILKNSNGRPMRGKRKEDKYNGYANFDGYIDGVLRGEPEYKPHFRRDAEDNLGSDISVTQAKTLANRLVSSHKFSPSIPKSLPNGSR